MAWPAWLEPYNFEKRELGKNQAMETRVLVPNAVTMQEETERGR